MPPLRHRATAPPPLPPAACSPPTPPVECPLATAQLQKLPPTPIMASPPSAATAFAALNLRTLRCTLEPSGLLWVQLDRPRAFNALSMEMLEDLHAVCAACEHPHSMLRPLPPDFPRVLVLTAVGRAFCSGVDIRVRVLALLAACSCVHSCRLPACPNQPTNQSALPLAPTIPQAADQGVGGAAWDYRDMRSQQLLSRLIARLRALPQPIVAAVQVRRFLALHCIHCQGRRRFRAHPLPALPLCSSPRPQGVATGGGFALAMASDVRVAARDASFSAAFVKLGLTGGAGEGAAAACICSACAVPWHPLVASLLRPALPCFSSPTTAQARIWAHRTSCGASPAWASPPSCSSRGGPWARSAPTRWVQAPSRVAGA